MNLASINKNLHAICILAACVTLSLPILQIGSLAIFDRLPAFIQGMTNIGCSLRNHKYVILGVLIVGFLLEVAVRYRYQIRSKGSYSLKTIYKHSASDEWANFITKLVTLLLLISVYMQFSYSWNHCGG